MAPTENPTSSFLARFTATANEAWAWLAESWGLRFQDQACAERITQDDVHAAMKEAFMVDQELDSFAEKFRYTIATSYLLAPTLSISMYGRPNTSKTDATVLPMGQSKTYTLPHVPLHHTVQCRLADQVPIVPVVVGASVLLLASLLRIPLAPVLLALMALDASLVKLQLSNHWQWPPQDMVFAVATPSAMRPHFLAASVPLPIWVKDERIRLHVCLLHQAQLFVQAAQRMDRCINNALAAVQEVELVSRGFPLTSPLPPISRMEAATAALESTPTPGARPTYPQRFPRLRKAIADAVEEMSFHCRTTSERLNATCLQEDPCIHHGLVTVRHKPGTVKAAAPAPSSVVPRTLSLSPFATPPRPAPRPGSPEKAIRLRPPMSEGRLSAPPVHAGTPLRARMARPSDSPSTLHQPLDPVDRLALASLRRGFEHMHTIRQALLYRILSLDLSMKTVGDDPQQAMALHTFWDEEVLHGTLMPLTTQFDAIADTMQEALQSEVAQTSPAAPSPSSLRAHSRLGPPLVEMARRLRALQCKLCVCEDELNLSLPRLHGEDENDGAPWPADEASVRDMVASMRADLDALMQAWEAGYATFQAPPPPSSTRPLCTPPPMSPTALPAPVPLTMDSDLLDEPEEFQSGVLSSDTLDGLLRASTSTAQLPRPGGPEDVYESEPAPFMPSRPRSTQSRAERIRLAREEREKASAQHFDAQHATNPFTIVNELKSVLERRTHPEPTTPPSPSIVSFSSA